MLAVLFFLIWAPLPLLTAAPQRPAPALPGSPAEVRARADRELGLDAGRLARLEQRARETLAELAPRFPGTPSRPIVVTAHRDADSLPAELREHLHEGTPGFVLLGHDEIHLLLDEIAPAPPGDLRTVLRHEMVHVLLDQFAGQRAPLVPRWLHEGLAQVLSDFTYLGTTEEGLVYVMAIGRLPRLSDLERDFPADDLQRRRAYAFARSFTAYLVRETSLETILEAVSRLDDEGFSSAWLRVTHHGLGREMEAWRDHLLNESGAPWRILFNNCFQYLMIAAVGLLAFAAIRRFDRESRIRKRLELAELAETAAAAEAAAESGARPDSSDHADHGTTDGQTPH